MITYASFILSFIYISTYYITVVVYAPVAQERPPSAHLLAVSQVDAYHPLLFVSRRGAIEHFALRTGHEGRAPELYAVGKPTGIGFEAHPVNRHHRQPVGHGMATLNGGPRLALALLLIGRVRGRIAYGRGLDEQFGSL